MTEPRPRKRTDRSRIPWAAVSVVFLVVILAGGIFTLIFTTATKQKDARPSGTVASSCPQDLKTVPLPAAGPATWEMITAGPGLTLPASNAYGPHVRQTVPHCFSQGEGGALFAAANFATWYLSGADLLNAFEVLAWPDDARSEWQAELVAKCGTDLAGCPSYQPPPLVAYQLRDLTGDRINVLLVYDQNPGSGTWISLQVPLKWDGDDWKALLPAAGPLPTAHLTSLENYVPWRAQ